MVKVLFAIAISLLAAAEGRAQPCPDAKPAPAAGAWKGTPLHDAIRENDVVKVRRLLEASAVNERDSIGNTPLVAALTPVASLDPVGANPAGARARIRAENSARQAIVSALVTHGAMVTERGAGGTTPLGQLAAWGYSATADRRLAETFLKLGAEVDARDEFGTTPLMQAARRGKLALVTVLLSAGADPTLKNCRGENAASLAQFAGFVTLANELTSARRPR